MRKGKHEFDMEKISIAPVVTYLGVQVANSLVSFLLVFIILVIVFVVLLHPLLWELVVYYRYMIIGLVANKIVTVGLVVGAGIFLIDAGSQRIKHRGLWSVFEVYMLYASILAGIFSAISRIIMLVVFTLIGLSRLDQPLFPSMCKIIRIH